MLLLVDIIFNCLYLKILRRNCCFKETSTAYYVRYFLPGHYLNHLCARVKLLNVWQKLEGDSTAFFYIRSTANIRRVWKVKKIPTHIFLSRQKL